MDFITWKYIFNFYNTFKIIKIIVYFKIGFITLNNSSFKNINSGGSKYY